MGSGPACVCARARILLWSSNPWFRVAPSMSGPESASLVRRGVI